VTITDLRSWLTTLADAQAMVPASEVLGRLPDEHELPASHFTCEQVAEVMHRTPACVRGWCRAGRLPGAYRMGDGSREWRIPLEALDDFRATQRKPSTPKASNDLGDWRTHLTAVGGP
jgi:hypothetical protein